MDLEKKSRFVFCDTGSWTVVSVLFFVVAAVLTGLIAGFYPLINDDVVFADVFGCPLHTVCPGTKIDLFSTIREHHMSVNGRFGDMFSTLFVLLPGWIYGTVYALLFSFLLWMMARIAGIGFRRNPLKMIWLVAFALLFFPWPDYLYIRALFLNYFPAAIFGLGAVRYFISEKKARGGELAGLLVVAFFAGCWHEEMPLILLPSAVVYCCITRSLTRNQMLVAAGIALGVAFLLTCPAFFNRTDQIPDIGGQRKLMASAFAMGNLILSVTALGSYYFHYRGGKRTRKSVALVWALALPVVPSILLMLSSLMSLRMCFFSMVFSITALAYVFSDISCGRRIKGFIRVISVSVMILISGQLVLALAQTIRTSKSISEIIRLAAEDNSKPIYYDLDRFNTSPMPTFYKNYGRRYVTDSYTRSSIAHYSGRKFTYDIVSPSLRDFNLDKADTLDAHKGYFFYDGCILKSFPSDSTKYLTGIMRVSFEDGAEGDYEYIGTYFEDMEGRALNYLYPNNPVLPKKRVVGIEILTEVVNIRIQ